MIKNLKLSKAGKIITAGVVVFLGLFAMTVILTAQVNSRAEEKKESLDIDLPGAGMGAVVEGYIGATGDSSIELLSTTPVAAGTGNYNEFYDSKGNILGKLIVYAGSEVGDIYDIIPGTEAPGQEAQVVGHIYYSNVATLVKEEGEWYQVFSDGVNGFIKKDDFATGKDAEAMNMDTYINAVEVHSPDIYLYTQADENSAVMCVLPQDIDFYHYRTEGDYSHISVPGLGEGWVKNDDVEYGTIRKYASTCTSEYDAAERINEGVSTAQVVEQEKAQQRALQNNTQLAMVAASVAAPGPVDTSDTAALRQAIANYAQQFVGVLPYVWGSSDLSYGADCSGFTSAIYRAFGINISRSSDAQTWGGMSVPISDVRPGDIVCYPGHVALYVGNNTVVHEGVPGTTAAYLNMYNMGKPIINIARYIN